MLAEKKLAIFGSGVMGGAIARGLVRSGAMNAAQILLSDINTEAAQRVAEEIGTGATVSHLSGGAAAHADILLFAVKPYQLIPLLHSLKDYIRPNAVVISIAAGVSTSSMELALAPKTPVIRAMPNAAAKIAQSATALAAGKFAEAKHLELATELFSAVGLAVTVEERLLDAVTGLSGSGPAYLFLVIEALTDGGVKAGIPRSVALQLATQTTLGAAQMVLSGSDHPAALKDSVTTPGGTTIAGLAVLEEAAVRSAFIDAVEAAAQRSRELSQQ